MCVRTQIIRRTHIAQDEDEDVDMGNDSLVAKNKKLIQLLCLSQQRNEKAKAKIAGLKKEKKQLVRQNVALVERNLKLEKGFRTVTLHQRARPRELLKGLWEGWGDGISVGMPLRRA